jgi:hypothetical protein
MIGSSIVPEALMSTRLAVTMSDSFDGGGVPTLALCQT